MHQSKLVQVIKSLLFFIAVKRGVIPPLRGLCFDDIWDLYNTNKVEFEQFYKDNIAKPATDEEEDEEESSSSVSLSPELISSVFIAEHPKLAADIIARGLDSNKYSARKVARWPFEPKAFMLLAVIHHTLRGDEDVKARFKSAKAKDEEDESDSPAKKNKGKDTLGKIILGYRRDRSLLWANGQPDAGKYVLGVMIDEALIAAQRQKERQATESDLMMMNLSAMFDKKAGKFRADVIDELRGAKNG